MIVLKKAVLFILSSCLLLALLACSSENKQVSNNDEQNVVRNELITEDENERDVREVVYNQLSSEQKEWIDGNWKDGKVSKITLTKNMITQLDEKSYEGKEVYIIDFPTKSKSIPNNMIVYADVNTFDYIGNGLVD
nr:hypothetical protein [Aquibacillus kalidii]